MASPYHSIPTTPVKHDGALHVHHPRKSSFGDQHRGHQYRPSAGQYVPETARSSRLASFDDKCQDGEAKGHVYSPTRDFPPIQQLSDVTLEKVDETTTALKSSRIALDRRKSFKLPTHFDASGDGYGYSNGKRAKQSTSHPQSGLSTWLANMQNISTILVVAPYALSMALWTNPVPLSSSSSITAKEQMANEVARSGILATIAYLTATTVLLQTLHVVVLQTYRRPSSLFEVIGPAQWRSALQLIFSSQSLKNILGILLPFYATSQIGALRVGSLIMLSLSTGLLQQQQTSVDFASIQQMIKRISSNKLSLAVLFLQAMYDVNNPWTGRSTAHLYHGYLSLACALILCPPPFLVSVKSTKTDALSSTLDSDTTWRPATFTAQTSGRILRSPFIAKEQDIPKGFLLVLIIYGIGRVLTFLNSSTPEIPSGETSSLLRISSFVATALTMALVLATFDASRTRIPQSLAAVTTLALVSTMLMTSTEALRLPHLLDVGLVYPGVASAHVDRSISDHSSHRSRETDQLAKSNGHAPGASRLTSWLLHKVQRWPLLYTIILEKDSRRIFYFMILNFGFMVIQTFYGIVSGSLGLLSDSIHMFFDCLALIVGLSAAVMSKWPPSRKFPYGYAKIETLAGFANGVFLMLISIEIVTEALERLSSGRDIKRLRELMVVSVLGLLINLIGIMAFGHAHHGHDHGHSHGHDHAHIHSPSPSHDHHHQHQQSNTHKLKHKESDHDISHCASHVHGSPYNDTTPHQNQQHSHHTPSRSLLHRASSSSLHKQRLSDPQQDDQNAYTNPNGVSHSRSPSLPSYASPSRIASIGNEKSAVRNHSPLRTPMSLAANDSILATHQHKLSGHEFNHDFDQDCDHGHKRISSDEYAPLHSNSNPHSTSHVHAHTHASHGHCHHSENMLGIYLHVLGDALGSVAVVLSTWLISRDGWSGWDPLASSGIAIIIFGTAIPLVKNCAQKLLLTIPEHTEYDVKEALAGLSELRGVIGCTVPKFWIQEGDSPKVVGVVHVMADKVSNLEDVKERCGQFLRSAKLDVLVQVEREGSGRCWCQSSQ